MSLLYPQPLCERHLQIDSTLMHPSCLKTYKDQKKDAENNTQSAYIKSLNNEHKVNLFVNKGLQGIFKILANGDTTPLQEKLNVLGTETRKAVKNYPTERKNFLNDQFNFIVRKILEKEKSLHGIRANGSTRDSLLKAVKVDLNLMKR